MTKSHETVSESGLRDAILTHIVGIKDAAERRRIEQDIDSWELSTVEGLVHWYNTGYAEAEPFVGRFLEFRCTNCGYAHDREECIGLMH